MFLHAVAAGAQEHTTHFFKKIQIDGSLKWVKPRVLLQKSMACCGHCTLFNNAKKKKKPTQFSKKLSQF